jgi:hypothetical protein
MRARTEEGPARLALDLARLEAARVLGGGRLPPPGASSEGDALVDALRDGAARLAPPLRLRAAAALADAGRADDARTFAAGLGTEPLDPAGRARLLHLEGRLAESAGDRPTALARYVAALEADGERADAAADAVRLFVEGAGEARGEVERLLRRVQPAARRAEPELMLQEARWLRRAGRPWDARAALEQVLAAVGGAGELADRARAELAALLSP